MLLYMAVLENKNVQMQDLEEEKSAYTQKIKKIQKKIEMKVNTKENIKINIYTICITHETLKHGINRAENTNTKEVILKVQIEIQFTL